MLGHEEPHPRSVHLSPLTQKMIWHHYLRYRKIRLLAFIFVEVNPLGISEEKQKECYPPAGMDS